MFESPRARFLLPLTLHLNVHLLLRVRLESRFVGESTCKCKSTSTMIADFVNGFHHSPITSPSNDARDRAAISSATNRRRNRKAFRQLE